MLLDIFDDDDAITVQLDKSGRPMTAMPFCDLPDRIRLALREAIEEAGGEVEGYQGAYVQVAIPRPSGPFFQAMEDARLELDENSLHLFPLGTDKPAEHLRHHVGYWLYGNFSPAPNWRPPANESAEAD